MNYQSRKELNMNISIIITFYNNKNILHTCLSTLNETLKYTNEKIEGIVPNWELVKEKLIEMAHYYPQLKYLGYDIAITQKGFEIIEINSHQGLHKAHMFPKEVKEFFNREVEKKSLKYKR